MNGFPIAECYISFCRWRSRKGSPRFGSTGPRRGMRSTGRCSRSWTIFFFPPSRCESCGADRTGRALLRRVGPSGSHGDEGTEPSPGRGEYEILAQGDGNELARKISGNAPISNYLAIQAIPRISDMSAADGVFAETLSAILSHYQAAIELRPGIAEFLGKK